MYSATQNTPTQRLPAWKRLGLKLKGPASGESPAPAAGGTGSGSFDANHAASAHQRQFTAARVNGNSPATNGTKRKFPPATLHEGSFSYGEESKRARREDPQQSGPNNRSSAVIKKQKSVTFAEGTKDDRELPAAQTGSETAKKGVKTAGKKEKLKRTKITKESEPEFSLEPALAYLRQWHTARESWKFNKNHQTLLIKNAFDADRILSADIDVFYEYIRALKGFVRTRLREAAAEVKRRDMDQGVGAFPARLKDRDTKQKEYEEVLSRLLQQQRAAKQQGDSSNQAGGKRSFDEVEFVLRTADPDIKRRLLKRIRAELVLDQVSDGESSTSTEVTSTGASSSGEATTEKNTDLEQRADLSNGRQPRLKRQRRNKVRTDAEDSDESSSESVDSDASSSSSDEEDEEELGPTVWQNGAGIPSSSSSSSSSSAELASSESDEESESESEGDSEEDDEGNDED